MKKLIDDLNNMMDQKITDNEIATIESEVNILKEMLQKFEKNINMNISAGSFYSLTTKEQALAQDAKDINNKFSDIIGHCKQKLQVIPALPIFTAMATAHLEFLYFLEKNGTGPKLQYTTDALNTLLKGEDNEDFGKRIKNLAETYVNHVQKTYELGKQQFNKKMDDTAKNTPGGNVNSTSEQETMSKMQKYIFDLHPVANNADEKRKQMQVALNNYVKLRNDREQYYKKHSK
ncbi:insecticidal delta-endotoxin Cry8Ea1 family protein (plasmid) [Bacillus toyonensis]